MPDVQQDHDWGLRSGGVRASGRVIEARQNPQVRVLSPVLHLHGGGPSQVLPGLLVPVPALWAHLAGLLLVLLFHRSHQPQKLWDNFDAVGNVLHFAIQQV